MQQNLNKKWYQKPKKIAIIVSIIVILITAGWFIFKLINKDIKLTGLGTGCPKILSQSKGITVVDTCSSYKALDSEKKLSGSFDKTQDKFFQTGQAADLILGMTDFNKAKPNLFNHPMKIAFDSKRLILADTWNNRVLIWNSLPSKNNQKPDLVLGQLNLESNDSGLGADKFNWPVGVATDGKHLLVADTNNDRVLIWNEFPNKNGQPADLVLGADNFEQKPKSKFDNVSQNQQQKNQIGWPWEVVTDGQRVLVASTGSGAVLIWNEFPAKNGQSADIILDKEVDLQTPRGIGYDGTHLLIGDYNAKKTYVWNNFPKEDNQKYDFTLWQNPQWMQPHAWSMPIVEGKLLALIEDSVFVWNKFPTSSNDQPNFELYASKTKPMPENGSGAQPASSGQPSSDQQPSANQPPPQGTSEGKMPSPPPNQPPSNVKGVSAGDMPPEAEESETDPWKLTAKEFAASHGGIAADKNHLFVSNFNHNRVLIFNKLPTSGEEEPDLVLGADDFETNTYLNNYVIQNPQLGSDGKSLFVGSDFDRTFSVWKHLPDESLAKPDIVYYGLNSAGTTVYDNKLAVVNPQGKVNIWQKLPLLGELPDLSISPETKTNQGFKSGLWGTIACENYLFVGDKETNKIYVWEGSIPAQDKKADFTIDVEQPQQLSCDNKHLAAASFEGHSILIWNLPIDKNKTTADITIGGGAPNSNQKFRLNLPMGVFIDGQHLFAADTGNNRILIWNEIPKTGKESPDIVLGQDNLEDTLVGLSDKKMNMPSSLYFDGSYLWVGEYKFSNRILRFPAKY